jgi:hypothetical protein
MTELSPLGTVGVLKGVQVDAGLNSEEVLDVKVGGGWVGGRGVWVGGWVYVCGCVGVWKGEGAANVNR